MLTHTLAHYIAGKAVQMHRGNTAAKAFLGCCAIIPATMPVRISPVPPVAMPGLPVVFTQASPSGCATSVRWPLSTTIHSCSRANLRATPRRSF